MSNKISTKCSGKVASAEGIGWRGFDSDVDLPAGAALSWPGAGSADGKMLLYMEITAKLCSRKTSRYFFRYFSVCWPADHPPSAFTLPANRRSVSWSASSRRGSRAPSICSRQASRHTRNRAPRLPSPLPMPVCFDDHASSSSGATRLSHPIVRMAPASLMPCDCNEAMRFVVIVFISCSAWDARDETSCESGYRVCKRLMWAWRSNAEAWLALVVTELAPDDAWEAAVEDEMADDSRVGRSSTSATRSMLRDSSMAFLRLSRMALSLLLLYLSANVCAAVSSLGSSACMLPAFWAICGSVSRRCSRWSVEEMMGLWERLDRACSERRTDCELCASDCCSEEVRASSGRVVRRAR